MKYTIKVCLLLLSSFTFLAAENADRGKFVVEVGDLKNSKGTVRVILYEREGFLTEEAVKARFDAPIRDGKSVIETKQLPFGEYAMFVFHDENDNDEVDFNLFKMPKEGIGFSNNPKLGLSKPKFEESKVRLNESKKRIRVKLKYY
ncbi:DUF2141 domain-containing protein [Litoribacter populi]|uniref:DUF2141 domain-containing protein n=1 Tax=Litoribacter populi TaxID=2598460 RepID=UPI0011817468|nr:DUF2141 domain-containing protein [Litoribacter populi]